jgi:hypothetical protein
MGNGAGAMSMRREACIYALYALAGGVLSFYVTKLCLAAWEHFGLSVTAGALLGVLAVLVTLSIAYGATSLLFLTRGIAKLKPTEDGHELLLVGPFGGAGSTVRAPGIRHVRTIGRQFAHDETSPAFVVFLAAGKIWIIAVDEYRSATR